MCGRQRRTPYGIREQSYVRNFGRSLVCTGRVIGTLRTHLRAPSRTFAHTFAHLRIRRVELNRLKDVWAFETSTISTLLLMWDDLTFSKLKSRRKRNKSGVVNANAIVNDFKFAADTGSRDRLSFLNLKFHKQRTNG